MHSVSVLEDIAAEDLSGFARPADDLPAVTAVPIYDTVSEPATEMALDDDPGLLCANLALCVIEIFAGARSLDQLARWVDDAVFTQLLRRSVIAARARAARGEQSMRPRVRIGVPHVSPLDDATVEAVVLVHQPSRSRAIAMRLERYRARWRATAITVL